jgi:glycosyltransferase involved in cell wall biosynthesis
VRFVVHADQFNLGMPPGCFSSAKFVVREIIRKLIFSRALAILVCGRKGVDSALEAGCKAEKVIDFPYVIDISRMLSEKPTDLPLDCKSDVDSKKLIIMFSGRMIPRKGLETLIRTLPKLKKVDRDWILWIEGDGPELAQYENLAEELGVVDRCRFLGFCQFDSHGWLMSSCHIVVVPSLEDTWGIIVDEGLQLGKLVIASNAVGSGYDRIQSGINGYIFPTGNIDRLGDLLEEIIQNIDLRTAISEAAVVSSKIIRPQDNAEKLINLL